MYLYSYRKQSEIYNTNSIKKTTIYEKKCVSGEKYS